MSETKLDPQGLWMILESIEKLGDDPGNALPPRLSAGIARTAMDTIRDLRFDSAKLGILAAAMGRALVLLRHFQKDAPVSDAARPMVEDVIAILESATAEPPKE